MSAIFFRRAALSPLFCTALITVYIAGCSLPKATESSHDHGHGHSHGHDHHDHDHDHEDEGSSVTMWTDELEIFVKFDHLDAGTDQEFAVYLSALDTGLPVVGPDMSLQMKNEGATARLAP